MKATQLPDELQRRILNLRLRGRRFEIEQHPDIPAHGGADWAWTHSEESYLLRIAGRDQLRRPPDVSLRPITGHRMSSLVDYSPLVRVRKQRTPTDSRGPIGLNFAVFSRG